MTWKSTCSIASDDESSRHSFLSDCDSDYDLRPAPRYPAEKRSSSIINKRMLGRVEPPLTRSRLKATGKTLPSSPTLPKTSRSSVNRRNTNIFPNLNPTARNDLHQNMLLFTKQEASINNERVPSSPMDGVNFLTDRFENCSLDEEKIHRSGMWPSRETHSHYMRPITSPTPTFGHSSFSIFNQPSTPFSPSSPSSSTFGQQKAQLWSRFHFAASALRNDICVEQVQTSTTNVFTPNSSLQSSDSFLLNSLSPTNSLRQRKTETPVQSTNSVEPTPIVQMKSVESTRSSSKYAFTMMIFFIGIMLGYVLTSTFPPARLWSIFSECFHWFFMYFEMFVQYFQSSR